MLVIYLSSLIRSVIALHNLINNKVTCPLLTEIILLINWTDVCRLFLICNFWFSPDVK